MANPIFLLKFAKYVIVFKKLSELIFAYESITIIS